MKLKNNHGFILQPHSLSKRIYTAIFCFTISAVMCTTCIATLIYYTTHETRKLDELTQIATNTAEVLNNEKDTEEQIAILEKQFLNSMRFTLISKNGTVLSDSNIKDESSISNHSNRPEVANAKNDGIATVERYSNTLNQDTIYVAIKLDNENILRISEIHESLFFFLKNLFIPLCIATFFSCIFAYVNAKMITRRIIMPLENLDLSNPINCTCYKEMTPLLQRISEQQYQLKEQNKRLEEAVNARKIFTDNVSHEMKTPLQVISGYSELIKEGLTSLEDARNFSKIIFNEAQIMKKLIDDLLTLSHLTSRQEYLQTFKDVNLKSLVAECIDKLSPLAAKQNLEVTLESEDVVIKSDEDLLRTLITNLLSNAIRYNKENGFVNVSIDESLTDITIKIKDGGIGISQEDQEHIFERFYRTDKSRSRITGGTGLGLSIVKHIVLLFKGSINLDSTLDQGSTFTIKLPRIPK